MITDGTTTINPNGNIMYLVCTATKPSYGRSVRVKVLTLSEALEATKRWVDDNYMLRNMSRVKRAVVYVKGSALAAVEPFENKVYRADPLTERKDVTKAVLLDDAAYKTALKARDEKSARCSAIYRTAQVHRVECTRLVVDMLNSLLVTSHNAQVLELEQIQTACDNVETAPEAPAIKRAIYVSFRRTAGCSAIAWVRWNFPTEIAPPPAGAGPVSRVNMQVDSYDSSSPDSYLEFVEMVKEVARFKTALEGLVNSPSYQRCLADFETAARALEAERLSSV